MSVSYRQDSAKASKRRKVGREFAPQASSKSSKMVGDTVVAERASGQPNTSEKPVRRTPDASDPLFSMPQFSVNDVNELRQLMHEALTSFAVEFGTQVARCLLEEDVVKLCGAKSERVLDRVNSRHGTQTGYVILGGQKIAIRRPRVRNIHEQEVSLEVYEKL